MRENLPVEFIAEHAHVVSRCRRKMVAPKIRWKAPTRRRYCVPPCCIANVSNICAALSNVILGLSCLIASVARKNGNQPILTPGQTVARMPGDLQNELAVPPFME